MAVTTKAGRMPEGWAEALLIANILVAAEADALDRQAWQDWLDLYTADALFWVPSWISEHQIATDPMTEISMIYHPTRQGLEERVARLRSRKSVTSLPLPRTVHQTGGVHIIAATDDQIRFRASGLSTVYDIRLANSHQFAMRYEYDLRREPDGWRISAKVTWIINDRVPTTLDFYSI
jgi:benzoate/toluate 1,2-dioxygenase beta subunit/2,4,5-trichlorophenoxyacetic acid oxygenase 2